jgi:hypothetical protein
MAYRENPKLQGSGLLAAIPQTGKCPVGCSDCFFQSGRSFLEPLGDNLPNLPTPEMARGHIIRINDGNDSNVDREAVEKAASIYEHAFFNTSINKNLGTFSRPVVLTVNPGESTDKHWIQVNPIPPNLMFVRFRVNAWNLELCDEAVAYYTAAKIPVVLTFMAYYTQNIPAAYVDSYVFKKRTLNSYHCPKRETWEQIMKRYATNNLVYSCGKDPDTYSCARCGNCIREYFVTNERLLNLKNKSLP